ncbi:ribosomal protein S18 acetylase RimI-like enzyme [Paenibacillus sp. SORGH_AS306]|uniref:GNAT family N-acetyltransferase n=1 Tax=unclassified Paenibacillus TaxID=185978 RepID=UPI00278ADEFB|nr:MULTISPECIES: GNAT family N-acetyltransferase [unclassified Paenibacillus]MDQ1233737.1 ribosomal protein S18 acetylase RimI-like enzyme [Paenibacillus sp. SORGH_AS_0306]MDR6110779.1 ribosomal protein S18 acetylase RimI-like enzyme [Paenibacillus sp. SORGH_AS_0338]
MESSNYGYDSVLIRTQSNHECIPIALLMLADPDLEAIQRYKAYCRWWTAEIANHIVGVCGVLQRTAQEWEIMNIAVEEGYEGQGIGSKLLDEVLEQLKQFKANVITVATGNSSLGALAFYQKHGFRIIRIEHDHFTTHYEHPIIENGIVCRDQIILQKSWGDSNSLSYMYPYSKEPYLAMVVSVRIAQIRDSGALIRMKQKLDEQTTFMLLEPGERNLNEAEQRDMIRYALRSANSNIFLAEHEGQIIGYLEAIGGKVARNRHSVYIVVGVLQEYANRGIGRRLFQTMIYWAQDRHLHRLELNVQGNNERALHLYRSLGFRIEGIQKNALVVEQRYVDLIQMGLLL